MSINRTIKALGIAKSSVYYKPKSYPKGRASRPRKILPQETKSGILAITANKSTYGIPRVKAILSRDYKLGVCRTFNNEECKKLNFQNP